MTYPLVGDLAADGIPVAAGCRVLGFSKQAYYAWRASPVAPADLQGAHLINAAWDVHRDDPEFGYRFVADEAGRARPHRSLIATVPSQSVHPTG